jgi:hypothetical protein
MIDTSNDESQGATGKVRTSLGDGGNFSQIVTSCMPFA